MKEILRISLDKNEPLTELTNSSWHSFYIMRINEIIFYELDKEDSNNGGE